MIMYVFVFAEEMQGSISFGLNNSRIFFIFPKTTPVVFLPTALPSLYSLPGPQMARRAKKEEVTGGWQNWNEVFDGDAWQLH